MDANNLKDKRIAVLGFGKEGKAVTKYLLKLGIKPVLFDNREWEKWADEEKQDIKNLNINFIFGPESLQELKGFEIIFRSPGLSLNKLEPFLQFNPGCSVTSQTKYFFENCPAKIVGVTGTKGKGTTSTLIYEILKLEADVREHGSKTFLTGNIGKTQPLDFLDKLTAKDWVVFEMSSFQLQDLSISPHIGVVLMTTQEHLDYHKDVAEYLEAKSPIVKFQELGDFAIVNLDYENSIKIGDQGKGQKFYVSRRKEVKQGSFVKNGDIIFKDEEGVKLSFSKELLQLRGEHNLENVCAAITAAFCAGVSSKNIQKAVENFKGLEHRLELVAVKDQVKYYNDSFSTTPETAIAAIKSFNEPLIVILGGSSKNSDFTELGQTVVGVKNIKAVSLIGQEAERIKDAINKAGDFRGKILEGAKSMEEIFSQINSVKVTGDVVLLSPACASFGMFENYEDRGNQFKQFALQQ